MKPYIWIKYEPNYEIFESVFKTSDHKAIKCTITNNINKDENTKLKEKGNNIAPKYDVKDLNNTIMCKINFEKKEDIKIYQNEFNERIKQINTINTANTKSVEITRYMNHLHRILIDK